MKYFVLIALINFGIGNLNAQSDTAFLKVLEARIKEIQPEYTVNYSDLPFDDFEQIFPNEKLRLRFTDGQKEYIHLTNNEKSKIISKLKSALKLRLPDSLLNNSKRFLRDSIADHVEKLNKQVSDSIAKQRNLNYSIYVRRYWSFSFSLPIYLRNKTVMVFYYSYYDTSSGMSWLEVRMKSGAKWTRAGGMFLAAW
ncbi:MAG: hypothetical protein C5B52_16635 [Bacteroidetes bacterium]|nr:MAG: hypothetical protein C5B52_16635 [Bacteroidota bacterium]